MSEIQADVVNSHPKASVVLISPDSRRRAAVAALMPGAHARLVREFAEFPAAGKLSQVLDIECDAMLVDLHGAAEEGLALIEAICSHGLPVTVMACSGAGEPDVLIRAMRAGAREFFADPLAAGPMTEAFERAATRRRNATPQRKMGKLLVFRGAKGGAGVTTLAANFAVALTRESHGAVVLVDLHPQLGEVALSLGIDARFSITDALANASRLDGDFLATLLTRHESGLAVLASRDDHGEGAQRSLDRGAEKLFRVLREEFDYVVVDAGSCAGNTPDVLFEMADAIYLIMEANLPALRNARRMLSYFTAREVKAGVELVLNRFNSRMVEIDEESTSKALTRPADWKIPNDYPAVRGAQNLGIPLVTQQTAIARAICEMALAAGGRSGSHHEQKSAAELKGEKWKFWTSHTIKPLSTARSWAR